MNIRELVSAPDYPEVEDPITANLELRGGDVWLLQTLARLSIDAETLQDQSSKKRTQRQIKQILDQVKDDQRFQPETLAAAKILAGQDSDNNQAVGKVLAQRFAKSQLPFDSVLREPVLD